MSKKSLHSLIGNRFLWQFLSLCLVFGVWEFAHNTGFNPAFPAFSSTIKSMIRLIANGQLTRAYADTLQPLTIGLLFSALIGISLGISMGLSRKLEWFTVVPLIVLQAAPMAAVIPLIVFVYGIGFAAKFVAVVVLAAPGIILNSFRGIRAVKPVLIEMGEVFLATRWQRISKIIIPAASGMIVASLRMGLAGAFVGVILAELLITPTGIGDLITYYSSVGKYADMYATILSLLVLSTITVSTLQLVEVRYFSPHMRKPRELEARTPQSN